MHQLHTTCGEVNRTWYVVDAKDKVLGRIATEIARRLRGKHKPIYTSHVDTGDFVVVVNAADLRVTGKKAKDKKYYRHSGYPGGIKSVSAGELLEKKPETIIKHAVKGMLPKNKLGREQFKKLKVYPGKEHPHTSQMPQELKMVTKG